MDKQSIWRRLAPLALALPLMLSACGFHLKNSAVVPFASVFVDAKGDLRHNLRQAMRVSGSHVAVVDKAAGAQAVLQVLGETTESQILTINAAGRTAEMRLFYRVTFAVHGTQGKDYLAPQTIELHRDLSYTDTQILSKGPEVELLYKDMRDDAVEQIMRRISVVRPLS